AGPRPNSEGNGLMMLGGLLLILPGLISDALGLLLLVPPVQRAVSRTAERAVERTLREVADGALGDAFQQARMHRPDGKVVQGEVIRDEPAAGPLGDAFQQARRHRPDGKVVQGAVIRDEPGTGPGGSPQEPRPPLTR